LIFQNLLKIFRTVISHRYWPSQFLQLRLYWHFFLSQTLDKTLSKKRLTMNWTLLTFEQQRDQGWATFWLTGRIEPCNLTAGLIRNRWICCLCKIMWTRRRRHSMKRFAFKQATKHANVGLHCAIYFINAFISRHRKENHFQCQWKHYCWSRCLVSTCLEFVFVANLRVDVRSVDQLTVVCSGLRWCPCHWRPARTHVGWTKQCRDLLCRLPEIWKCDSWIEARKSFSLRGSWKLCVGCKLSRNQPTGLCFHRVALIQTCTSLYSSNWSPRRWRVWIQTKKSADGFKLEVKGLNPSAFLFGFKLFTSMETS